MEKCRTSVHQSLTHPSDRDLTGMEGVMQAIRRKEEIILDGFCLYLTECLSDYLDSKSILGFRDMLLRIKTRAETGCNVGLLCHKVTEDTVLRSRTEPKRLLEVRNLYALFYNMIGYLNITRLEAAEMLKSCFPGIFRNAAVRSVDKCLTKFKYPDQEQAQRILFFTSSDSMVFEEMMMKYAAKYRIFTYSNDTYDNIHKH